jgi:GxxExxY protein
LRTFSETCLQELQLRGLHTAAQHPVKVKYKGVEVGDYYADIVVENRVILELKTGETFSSIHEAQLLNYLKATEIKIGLLINFGKKKCEYKRLAY